MQIKLVIDLVPIIKMFNELNSEEAQTYNSNKVPENFVFTYAIWIDTEEWFYVHNRKSIICPDTIVY